MSAGSVHPLEPRVRPGARTPKILLLPGDGIGPEVCREAKKVLDEIVAISGWGYELRELPIGAAALKLGLPPLPDEVASAALACDAVLFGAVGDPAYDGVPPDERPEQGLGRLRRLLGVFANLRPVRVRAGRADASPLRPEVVEGTDLVVVRELLGDVYYGTPRGITGAPRQAVNTMLYNELEIRRIGEVAFQLARRRRGKVVSVDKANVLETSRLWRGVIREVGLEYPDVQLSHAYVDAVAFTLICHPRDYDVILTGNMFGDILSDEAGVLDGSIGTLASASLGSGPGLFEPVHGSAPDIAGRGVANPLGAIASMAEMLRWTFGWPAAADAVLGAIDDVRGAGCATPISAEPPPRSKWGMPSAGRWPAAAGSWRRERPRSTPVRRRQMPDDHRPMARDASSADLIPALKLDALVSRLNELHRTAALEYYLRIGRLIVAKYTGAISRGGASTGSTTSRSGSWQDGRRSISR